jgi:hypothetical protein
VRAPVTPRPNSPSGEWEESGCSQGGGGSGSSGGGGSNGDGGSNAGGGSSAGGPVCLVGCVGPWVTWSAPLCCCAATGPQPSSATPNRANTRIFHPSVSQAVNAVVPPPRLNDLVLQVTMQQLWILVGSIFGMLLACNLWAHESVVKPINKKIDDSTAEVKKELREMKGELREMKGELKGELRLISCKLDKVYGEAAVAKGFAMGTGLCAVTVAALLLLHRQS